MRGTLRLLALFLVGLGLPWGRAQAGPLYTIADLGTGILPTGMGSSGILFGEAAGQPYLDSGGGKSSVPGLSTGTNIVGVNAAGQIAGNLPNGDAYLASNGVVADLGTLGGASSNAASLNASGVVVGNAQNSSGNYIAFLDDGTMRALGTLGGASSYAASINTFSQVVGGAQTANGDQHAFLYQDGKMTDLGSLGGSTSGASAINDAGQIAGSSKTASGIFHAFLVSNGTMIDLGSLGNASYAFGLNDSGQVIGAAYIPGANGTFTSHAFLAATSGMLDLNTLIPGLPAGWILTTATGIDDAGQIVGLRPPQWRAPRLLADARSHRPSRSRQRWPFSWSAASAGLWNRSRRA